MKIFISHKKEDSSIAERFAKLLKNNNVDFYLDVLDDITISDGKRLTNHIKKNLNSCTDIIVIMTENTLKSEWVPFEVGMAANVDMKTATYLKNEVALPSYLEYWPRLRNPEDIIEYISVYNKVDEFYTLNNLVENYSVNTKNEIDTFYSELKEELNKKYNSLK